MLKKIKKVLLTQTLILLMIPLTGEAEVTYCTTPPGPANDGPIGLQQKGSNYSNLFLNHFNVLEGYVDILDKDATEINPKCLFDDGRLWLTAVSIGYNDAFGVVNNWSNSYDLIKQIRMKSPKSVAAALAETVYWISYAWDARGGGYASSVTDDGWKLYNERLSKAEAVLLESKSYAAVSPIWYDQMLVVQSGLDRSPAERDKVFLEGTSKFKNYYPTYFTLLNYLSPKWGGSWGAVDNLANWAVNNTKETEGNSMYARMYWYAYQSLPEGGKFFRDTYASWPKMKAGFDDLMQRHPNSVWNLNNYAKFSCLANDKNTYLALRKQIGNKVINEAWVRDATLDLCDHKLGYAN